MREELAIELQTFEKNFHSLLAAHEGKFVLIHGDSVMGAFDSRSDAIAWGYRELGNVPFLVKHVVKYEAPLSFVSHLLGV
jgi:class 3 adenylate cyclase